MGMAHNFYVHKICYNFDDLKYYPTLNSWAEGPTQSWQWWMPTLKNLLVNIVNRGATMHSDASKTGSVGADRIPITNITILIWLATKNK
jgi:hypothetical protein